MPFDMTYEQIAAHAPVDARVGFIRKTYAHLCGAILAFIALEAVILRSPYAGPMVEKVLGARYGWLMVLGAFMAVGWVAERWARSGTSSAVQYLGLGLYVVAEAIIFVPLLYIAVQYDATVIPKAGLVTAITFVGLTFAVLITKKDFSFMRTGLVMLSFAALGLIVASILFGFSLGLVFSGAMVVLAGGYILYYTSRVLHHYPVGSHVAASLALFSAVALMFWYVLRLFMRR